MSQISADIREYTALLQKGQIQRAYKGIMSFMSDLKAYLERAYPEYLSSALYCGYMDMTYFAFTPPELKDKKLKIALAYLHAENRFECWLAGANRKVQADYIKRLSSKDLGGYKLSKAAPGVDSIIESIVDEQPDFDRTDGLKTRLEKLLIQFSDDVLSLIQVETES